MHQETTPSKDLLHTILYQHSRAVTICEPEAELVATLKYLKKLVAIFLAEDPLPTLKSMANDLGISNSAFQKRIHKIHKHLLSTEHDDVPVHLNQGPIHFILKGYKGYKEVRIEGLRRIPRRTEHVDFPHYSSVTGSTRYHVSDVYHALIQGEVVTQIVLKDGTYSPYWELRRSRAEETHEAPRNVLWGRDHELRDYLNIGGGRDW